MKTPFVFSEKRGSALLIVLGLLCFLMISAVAFSISMRTEREAASSYRRGLLAREMLENAFVDARATVEVALRNQQSNFSASDASTHTVENLAPFRYGTNDQYGRVMASYDSSQSEDIAYLLDDAVMRHIPPYIAYSVYQYLEKDNEVIGGDGYTSSGSYGYKLDAAAGWKPIKLRIAQVDDADGSGSIGKDATMGRMAWAVVNLSDALDLNAVGSASIYRGIGFTGSEFAFGDNDKGFALLETSDTSEDSALDLPTFCSNADIARYAATDGSSDLNSKSGDFAWQAAVDDEGEGYFSPFACYGFWPKAERTGETESDKRADTSSSTTITCDQVTETSIESTEKELTSDVQSLAGGVLGSDDAGQNFVRLLLDYIDTDSVPALFHTGGVPQALYANAQPTVEKVPMVSEVGYDATAWTVNDVKTQLEEMVEKTLEKVALPSPVKNASEIATTLKGVSLTFELPSVALDLSLRAYFPGYETSDETYDITPSGFVGVWGAGNAGSAEIDAEKGVTTDLSVSGTTFRVNSGSDVFSDESGIVCKPKEALSLTFKGDNIPITYEASESLGGATPPNQQSVTFTFLTDYFFHVDALCGSDTVDRCPTDKGLGSERTKSDYPTKSLSERFSVDGMKYLDAQYFRVTCPVQVSFALKWELGVSENSSTGEKQITYKDLQIAENSLSVKVTLDQECAMGAQKLKSVSDTTSSSYQVASAQKGTWFTIDPRYNWLSPMLGLSSDSATAYGTNEAIRQNCSSPHWLFVQDKTVSSGAEGSTIQEDYASKNSAYVPFKWGLTIKDIRYGYNDCGQLLLPGEAGFLPVPLKTDVWHPNPTNYNANSIADYYSNVAKFSFFRTVPITDLSDSACSYDTYKKLCTMFGNFACDGFPEEHRGLVYAFAAQDNYYVAQQLRQFALLGLPQTIQQAAKVTYDRLNAAADMTKVPEALPKALGDVLTNVKEVSLPSADEEGKYDTFVRDYLFPLPTSYTAKWPDGCRPQTVDFIVQDNVANGSSFADLLKSYNGAHTDKVLGQNDMTTLLSMSKECFGDRQQLFLYILRADAIAYNSGRDLSKFRPLSTARAVALVWRDAYGELPDRVIYYQVLP